MKKYLLVMLPVLLIFTSCEKILDKEPTDQLSIADLFKDVAGAKTALAGAYNGLRSGNTYGMRLMIYPDLMAGNLKYEDDAETLMDIYNFNYSAQESLMNSTYTDLYAQLNNVNNIISYVPTASGTEAERAKIIAEAKCLRALIHFDLMRIFTRSNPTDLNNEGRGIVVNLKPQLYSDPAPVRSTLADTYTAITRDLEEAVAVFDNSNAGSLTLAYKQNGFTKNSAKALLAKVYLYQQNWEGAFTLADDLIKTGGYTLITNANYVSSWTGRIPSTESILELPVETAISGTTLGSYYSLDDDTYRAFAASNDLLNLYAEGDIRQSTTMFNTRGNSLFFTKKYGTGGTSATPIKLLRLSEIYLIRAEAAVEKSTPDFTLANSDLTAIRKRAMPSAAPSELTDKTQLIDAILLERRKELAFEGNYVFDLIRRKQGITRIDGTAKTMNLDFTDYRMIMPIPKVTADVNINMIQNKGY